MSKITDDDLTRSGTGCFIAVPIWQQWMSPQGTCHGVSAYGCDWQNCVTLDCRVRVWTAARVECSMIPCQCATSASARLAGTDDSVTLTTWSVSQTLIQARPTAGVHATSTAMSVARKTVFVT